MIRAARRRPLEWALAAAVVFVLAAMTGSAAPARAAATNADSSYGRLLSNYVTVISEPGAPLLTRFDYARLAATKDHTRRLAAIRARLVAEHAALRTAADRLAWAIDTYNFLVIDTVVGHLGDFAGERASVMDVEIGSRGFFEAPIVEIAGVHYSLNDFERRFVFAGYGRESGEPPPPELDPRAHFALVCAARGCPPLLPRPYRSDSLDAQLDFVTRQALASPVHLRWDGASRRLEASSVFDWYAADFGGPQRALTFLVRYAPKAIGRAIGAAGITRITHFIPWDWRLNQTPRE